MKFPQYAANAAKQRLILGSDITQNLYPIQAYFFGKITVYSAKYLQLICKLLTWIHTHIPPHLLKLLSIHYITNYNYYNHYNE